MPLISSKQPSIILPKLIIPVRELNADPYAQAAELPSPPEIVFNDNPGGSKEKETIEVPLEHIKSLGIYMFGFLTFKSLEDAQACLLAARGAGMAILRYLGWGYKVMFFNPKKNIYTLYEPPVCNAKNMRADLGLPLRLSGRLADELQMAAPTINAGTKADVAASFFMMYGDIAHKKSQGEHLILKKPEQMTRTIHPRSARALQ